MVRRPAPLPVAALAALAALGLCAGCGGPREEETTRAAAPAVAHRAEAAGRAVVATVNGEPIYDDCVARQAAARGLAREEALAECIDFELLAQEALRRGYQSDPGVLDARRAEMVRELVASEYVAGIDEPADVPDEDVRWLWKSQLKNRYNKPERRAATYCRVPVSKKAPRDGEKDLAARAAAERIHRALRGVRFTPHLLVLACHLASGGRKMHATPVPTEPFSKTGRHDGGFYSKHFARAAFAVEEVGQVSAPTRTEWGWDLVLLTEIRPKERRTFEDAEAEIREQLVRHPETAPYRIQKFEQWIAPYMAAARIEVYEGALGPEQALAGPAPGAEAPGR